MEPMEVGPWLFGWLGGGGKRMEEAK